MISINFLAVYITSAACASDSLPSTPNTLTLAHRPWMSTFGQEMQPGSYLPGLSQTASGNHHLMTQWCSWLASDTCTPDLSQFTSPFWPHLSVVCHKGQGCDYPERT